MDPITKNENGVKLTLCEVCKHGFDVQAAPDTYMDLSTLQPDDYGCYTIGNRDYWPLYKIA